MHFERTRHYYNACTEYRQRLREIWAAYEKKMQSVEQYRGSVGFEKDKAKAERERDAAISELQKDYSKRFTNIIDGMRTSATTRSMVPPTQDELALLQALKMRDRISRDELEQAGRTFKNSPVCLSVLEEIVQDLSDRHGARDYLGLRFATESTRGIMKCIDDLEESAKRICKLDKCDSKAEMLERRNIYNPGHVDAVSLYSFRVDHDVDSIGDAMSFFGGVRNLESFEAAVNE